MATRVAVAANTIVGGGSGGTPVVEVARVGSPPAVDGDLDEVWRGVVPLSLPVGVAQAGDGARVDIRAAVAGNELYLLVRWPQHVHPMEDTPTQDRLSLLWNRGEPLGGCAIVCHTAYATGPVASYAGLTASGFSAAVADQFGGGWRDGYWSFAYSRGLTTANPLDIQFDDLGKAYHFGLSIHGDGWAWNTQGERLLLVFG